MWRMVVGVGLALSAFGCADLGQGGDGDVPGDALGTYHVSAQLQDSSCGPGALGSSERWDFDVKLSRHYDELWWLHAGEAIEGRIAPDGISFAFETLARVEMQPAEKGHPGCTMTRLDRAAGQLSAANLEVAGFSGQLSYGFDAVPGTDCSLLGAVEGGLAALPCEMRYQMKAVRTAGPE